MDISEEAVALAQKNTALNGVDARVLHGDIRQYRERKRPGFMIWSLSTAVFFLEQRESCGRRGDRFGQR
jgi:hypothetical protein